MRIGVSYPHYPIKKWRWAIYIEENMKKEVNYLNYLNCRKYKNNLDNSNALVVY